MGQGGPKTDTGKAASSRNAVKHGLLSAAPLTTRYEKPEEWEAHRSSILADLQPRNHAETCLAERAAVLQWRLRRIPLAEAELFDREAAEQSRYSSTPSNARRDAFALFPSMNALERLARYEAHLGRELARTLKALHDLQSRPIETAKTENCETNSPPPSEKGQPASSRASVRVPLPASPVLASTLPPANPVCPPAQRAPGVLPPSSPAAAATIGIGLSHLTPPGAPARGFEWHCR